MPATFFHEEQKQSSSSYTPASPYTEEEGDILDLTEIAEPAPSVEHTTETGEIEKPHHHTPTMAVPSSMPLSNTQLPEGQRQEGEVAHHSFVSTQAGSSTPSLWPENFGDSGSTKKAELAGVPSSYTSTVQPSAPNSPTSLNTSLSTPTFKGNPMAQLQSTSQPSFQEEDLASKETVSSSSQALNKLVQAVKPQVQSVERTGGSAPTLDTLISDLARPLVKQWIDQNLSHMVETMVSREIEKITKNLLK